MFKHILIIFILIILIILYCVLFRKKELYYSDTVLKYILKKKDISFFKEKCILSELKQNDIFYSDQKWSTKNNNYFLFNNQYYIIEPGYYYRFLKDSKLFIENDICAFIFKKIK
jgi:hypothetical protein